MRKPALFPLALSFLALLILYRSIEHGEIDVVAVNDPFIDPNYAVSSLRSLSIPFCFTQLLLHALFLHVPGS